MLITRARPRQSPCAACADPNIIVPTHISAAIHCFCIAIPFPFSRKNPAKW
jgi:hypothetical protein